MISRNERDELRGNRLVEREDTKNELTSWMLVVRIKSIRRRLRIFRNWDKWRIWS